MTVTIHFKIAPGPKQIIEITLRIDTADFVDAVAQAINQALTITTVEIEKIVVENK